VIHCNPSKSDNFIESEFHTAYKWIVEQMKLRVGNPPKDVKYPIWAWHYESWAEEHVENYVVFAGGLYKDNIKNAGEWVSCDLFSLVKDSSVRGYHLATANMLPRTQRTTAGFFHYFL
jgi:hypothetical protein